MKKKKLKSNEKKEKLNLKGIPVTVKEKKALLDLEKSIGEKISPLEDFHFPYGYVVENKHVVELGISYKNLKEDLIPHSIVNLKWLTKIDFSWNNTLKALPIEIGSFEFMEEIELANCGLKTLPDEFCNLKKLKHLSLFFNGIKYLPESFGNLTNLIKLDLNGHYLKELPESFGELHNLQELNLKGISLPKLPDSFFELKSLKELVLDESQIRNFPKLLKRKLKSQGCRIYYDAREWQGGPGGQWETVTRIL